MTDDLRALFEKFGPINTCKVMVDKATGQSRQIGFVRYPYLSRHTTPDAIGVFFDRPHI